MIVVVMVMNGILFVNHALNGTKLLHVARNGNGALLVESIFFLGSLQEVHEEWVVDVDHRDHKPLLLLSLSHHDRQTPLWDVFQFLLLMIVAMKVKVWNMKMKIQMVVVVVLVLVFVIFLATDNSHFVRKISQESKTDTMQRKKRRKTSQDSQECTGI